MSLADLVGATRVDRSVDVGSVALRLGAYHRDGAAPLAPVPGLRVMADDGSVGAWHESTGVYGFLSLAPGERTFTVTDPRRRYLPRACAATAPDREALRAALLAGAPPPVDAGPTWAGVPCYPTVELPIPPAETVLWGVVQRGTTPVPFAFVQLAFAGPTPKTWRGAADANGVYVLWLRGLVPDDLAEPPTAQPIRAFAPLGTPTALPAGFDALDPAGADFATTYDPTGSTTTRTFPLGARTRIDLPLP